MDQMEDASSSKEIGSNDRDEVDEIEKMRDERWKRGDEMEQEGEMKKWGYR